MEKMRLHPGDKVRITQNAWEHDCETIAATEGSIGTVLSYEEYAVPFYRQWRIYDSRSCAEHLAELKKCIEGETQYPIRFELVMPLAEDLRVHLEKSGERFFVDCKVGGMTILGVEFLEKITMQISTTRQ